MYRTLFSIFFSKLSHISKVIHQKCSCSIETRLKKLTFKKSFIIIYYLLYKSYTQYSEKEKKKKVFQVFRFLKVFLGFWL